MTRLIDNGFNIVGSLHAHPLQLATVRNQKLFTQFNFKNALKPGGSGGGCGVNSQFDLICLFMAKIKFAQSWPRKKNQRILCPVIGKSYTRVLLSFLIIMIHYFDISLNDL